MALSRIESLVSRIVRRLPDYEERPQQLEMARVVAESIRDRRHAVVEAGTGSGKSFGYLIPILESGKKAVISTATSALQEQLLRKDIPFLESAFGRQLKVALAKGRGNYICLRKLHEVDQSLGVAAPERPVVNDLIAASAGGGWTGDRADLPFLVESRFWRESLASDGEDCLGPRCANYAFTPHHLARLQCDEAELIIANHALYFTDMATGSGVLPQHDLVVFDEGHHLPRAATAALTVSVDRWTLLRLLQRLQRRFAGLPVGLQQRLQDAEWQLLGVVMRRGRGQFPIEPDGQFEVVAAQLAAALLDLSTWIANADPGQLKLLDSDGPQARQRAEIQREQMSSVAQDLSRRWDQFAAVANQAEGPPARAYWMRVEPARDFFELHAAPLDVQDSLREALWSKRTCILTSATMAVDGGFQFLRRELGLDCAEEAILGSPFRFEEQALLYIPDNLPLPGSPDFNARIIPLVEQIIHLTRGRAFVLFTSYRSLREVAAALVDRLPFPCMTQEDLPRQRLVDWFRSTPNSVLFATATFWEGVDIPGESLSCVIIDKLPFASPDDPVNQARTERMKAAGEDWFDGYVLPKAIISLKQGFGRLIRSQSDVGVIAILDRRLLTKYYGQVILRSLPRARRITALPASLDDWFARGVGAGRA
jgi:ATP-dependent DNA helicase DinG